MMYVRLSCGWWDHESFATRNGIFTIDAKRDRDCPGYSACSTYLVQDKTYLLHILTGVDSDSKDSDEDENIEEIDHQENQQNIHENQPLNVEIAINDSANVEANGVSFTTNFEVYWQRLFTWYYQQIRGFLIPQWNLKIFKFSYFN